MIRYWTTYGCSVNLPATSRQWRIPLSLQIVLAAIVIAAAFMVPESPRWLAKQDRLEESRENLAYLRGAAPDSAEVMDEMAEIQAQIQEELSATNGRTVGELFQRQNFIRIMWALG
jgi:hypothetical protein